MAIKVGAGKTKSAGSPEGREFALGTRPPNLRDFPIQRTMPVNSGAGTRNYGKAQQGPRQPAFGGGFGSTGQIGS